MNKTVLTLLGTVRESYDYVLIDLPPLGSVIDAAVVAAKCDGAILVISDHQVRCHQAVEVVDQLKKCGSRILGVVRNNIHANSNGHASTRKRVEIINGKIANARIACRSSARNHSNADTECAYPTPK